MMIGMGTPISQSSAPLPNPMSMSSVWPATAPAHAQTFVGQKMFRPRTFGVGSLKRRLPEQKGRGAVTELPGMKPASGWTPGYQSQGWRCAAPLV